MENVLIVGAHYDDAELGAGGTAAKLVAEGKNVYKITLTNNETHFAQQNIDVSYETSLESSKKACQILGVHELTEFIPNECSKLTYSKENMQRLEELIYKYKIDTVFLHFSEVINWCAP